MSDELFLQAKKEYGGKIHATTIKLIPPEDQQDVESTIWLSIWTALQHFDGRSSVGTFIYPITRRRIADYFRGRYRRTKLLTKIENEFTDAQTAPPSSAPPIELSTVLLTPAEIGVLRLIADVMSNQEIAQALFVGQPTVRTHVKNIYRKTKIQNRGNLILFAREFWKKEKV